ncbi:MAG: HD domain-containing protein [Candidatus Mcinerneyibacterium aminivorans]|uniref:HD domain-containing protein n=1 Tax=Candidatus Mcinerneyibacterium aminivorans TaxID=2703815 RepID=A0A5D0MI28_9BACT|nr:MAG: HD domain-containing protein [Candidatus Mcinerneyibacterium aminivorans]
MKIGLAIENKTNLKLFVEEFGLHYDIVLLTENNILNDNFDLIIVDRLNFDYYKSKIIEAKTDQKPSILPVLLIVEQKYRKRLKSEIFDYIEDIIWIPVYKDEIIARVQNMLTIRNLSKKQKKVTKSLNEDKIKLNQELKIKNKELKKRIVEAIHLLVKASEFKDVETSEHIKRVGKYARLVANIHERDSNFSINIFYAAPMHDIGKIGIPESILLKNGKLTNSEFKKIKEHPSIGHKILQEGNTEVMKMGTNIALHHHEYYDGSGYPEGLSGKDISLEGRIMTICDVYDALRSERPYKKPYSHDKAIDIILNGDERTSPDQFDPNLLDILKKNHKEFDNIYKKSII